MIKNEFNKICIIIPFSTKVYFKYTGWRVKKRTLTLIGYNL